MNISSDRSPTISPRTTRTKRRLVRVVRGEITAAKLEGMLTNDKSKICVFYPKISKFLQRLAKMLPSEAMCERIFSILKRVISAQRSRLTVENAAAALEARFLSQQNWNVELPPQVSDLDVFGRIFEEVKDDEEEEEEEEDENQHPDGVVVEEDAAVVVENKMTAEVAMSIVSAAVGVYLDVSDTKGSKKCEHCKVPFTSAILNSRFGTIQCKNQSCAKRWCYQNNRNIVARCSVDGNGLCEAPTNDGHWECLECLNNNN